MAEPNPGLTGSGWIKLHRERARHPLWTAEPFTRGQAWVDLLLRANYADSVAIRGNRRLPVRRGQVLTSIQSLGTGWKRDRKTVRAWLLVFEQDGMLARDTASGADGGYTLLTIRNYEHYQSTTLLALDGAPDGALANGTDGKLVGALAGGLAGALPTSKKSKNNQEGEERARARDCSPLSAHVEQL